MNIHMTMAATIISVVTTINLIYIAKLAHVSFKILIFVY